MVQFEFKLTPNSMNAFARGGGSRVPIKQGNRFGYEGEDRIDFEDAIMSCTSSSPKILLTPQPTAPPDSRTERACANISISTMVEIIC